MKAVVTVIGCDRIGIIAGVTNALAKVEVNILDISQTIMDNYFTMIMMVDISNSKLEFIQIQDMLSKFGDEMKLSIRIQRQDLFDSMYNI